ncbi:MAG TPA: DUF1501 domain-containing protein [Gemmataceae bacterium]|jgi:uncharacterized protein (DUF1501 family)|nr:DUF1501 domain-containing protein [Gemmataceae bacterium]
MTANRRDFLKASVASAGLVSWGLGVPGFLARTAAAAPASHKPGGKDTLLVVVELNGGNDGLNTVIPFKDPLYAKYRPTLKLPTAELKKVNDEIGLHPQLGGLAELLQDNALSIVQGVGYPNPNESHFRSMDIWQTASLAETAAEGWLGKALKGLPAAPAFHLKSNNQRAPVAFDGAPVRPPSINTLEEFQLQMAATSGADKKQQREIIEGAAKPGTGKPDLLDFVRRTATNTYASSRRLQEIGKNYQPKVPYPNTPLAGRLKLAAQLIDADLGARIFYVSIGGFDTHATQAPAHANLMGQLSAAMTAFFKDVAARGHRDRVLMMTFSEFGRRVKENGSKGTDHGSAAPMLLVGGKVKAGLVGAHPTLTSLDANTNLKHHTDFRQVYAAVLDRWLGVPSKDVLGEAFKPVDVLKS